MEAGLAKSNLKPEEVSIDPKNEARLAALLHPTHLHKRSEVLHPKGGIPAVSGVYAWWFRDTLDIPVRGCLVQNGMTLLFVGISPKAPAGPGKPLDKQTMRSRVRYHFTGSADGSTLRLSIGCLLGKELRRIGLGKKIDFADDENEISDWLQQNTRISYVEHSEPWLMEAELIGNLSLPLNLEGNTENHFHEELTAIRSAAKKRAIKLPPIM